MSLKEEIEKIKDAANKFRVAVAEADRAAIDDDEFVDFMESVTVWLTELALIKSQNDGTADCLLGATCTNCGKTMTAQADIFIAYDEEDGSGKKGVCSTCAEKEPQRFEAVSNGLVRQALSGEFDFTEISCEGCGANNVRVPPNNLRRVRCNHCGRTIELG